MKSTLVLLLCFIAATATVTIASPAKRDVSEITATIEPEGNYLPPAEAETEKATITEAADDQEASATPLSANGYEYKTVRKIRYRNRRDVSHLNLGYLPPPAAANSKLTLNYLPPAVKVAPATSTPTISTSTTRTTTVAPQPLAKLSNEYLPPVQEQFEPLLIIADTEAPEGSTESAESTTTTAPDVTDAPSATESAALRIEEVPEETAVFADDGYHYKRPQVIPDLAPAAPKFVSSLPLVREYLPPLEDGVVVAEGPGEETSVLADDGYHIRAIRRLRY